MQPQDAFPSLRLGARPRPRSLRFWSVRQARFLEGAYSVFARVLRAIDPALRRVGYERLERSAVLLESFVKGALFDCRMCGQCILSETGMSCPMNCPKAMRNGPCGGVRADGGCEIHPETPCVWVKAFEGDKNMRRTRLLAIQGPIDQRKRGRSSWLAVARGDHAV